MKVLKQLSPSELQHVLNPITKTMAIISPFYVIVFPFVILCTIPVAIFASITSVLAFSVLAFRVVLIYIELLVAVVPYYILGATDPPGEPLPRTKSFIDPVVRVRRRKRRSSSSNVSTGTITPGSGEQTYGLSQSIGPTRDFEGVGGWRLDNSPSDDDVLWTNINSRLELPADHIRRHQRSQTSGAVPLRGQRSSSPEAVATSPNTSRARTPPTTGPTAMTASNGYFSQGPVSPRTLKKMPSLATSVSGSSESSKGSSGLSMKRL